MAATGATLLAAQLRALDVDRIFTLNGGHIAPIYEACLDVGIAIVDVRHEDAAVHMAHAHARTTGRPGVACLTAGPGVTNGVSAIAAAWSAASPILVIGGKVPTPQADLGALQDVDQVSILRPVTRFARTVLSADRIAEYVAEALRQASIPPHAPTFLEVPTDLLRAPVADAGTVPAGGTPGVPAPSRRAVDDAAAMLAEAERPVMVTGSGVLWAHAEDAAARLAELLSMPVLTTSLARGILPRDHRLNLYAARSYLLSGADVILVVGSRFNYVLNYGRPPRFPDTARIIHVDASAVEVDRNRRADCAVVGDALITMEQLIDACRPRPERRWLDEARSIHENARRSLQEADPHHGGAIHPLALCQRVAEAVPDDTRYVVDGGDILSFARLAIQPTGPRMFLDPGPYGGLGAGVPFANAVQMAVPDAPVVCITGDGALGFNAMELDTAVRHELPVVVVVSNNSAWGIERNAQIQDYGVDRVVATELRDVRFDRLAESLGCRGTRVTEADDIGAAIGEALASRRPSLIDVVTAVDAQSPDLRRGLATVPDGSPLDWADGEEER